MFRIGGLIAISVAVAACEPMNQHHAEAYNRWTDRMIVRLGLPNVGIWPCPGQTETHDNFTTYIAQPIDKCFKMQPPQRWRGSWALGPGEHMERFCPNSSEICDWEKRPRFNLEWNERVFTSRPQVRAAWGKRYILEFVGRRTTYPSGYSNRDYVVVVDRLIQMQEIPPSGIGEKE